MAGVRSTAIETERRVFTIQGWIIAGVPDYLIKKNIQQQFQNANGKFLGLRQAKVLLEKAYKVWHEEESATIEQKRTLKIARLQQEIRSMDDKYKNTPQGMAVKLSYEKEINKLQDLYPARKHLIQGDEDKPLVFTTIEEKEKRYQQLLAKLVK